MRKWKIKWKGAAALFLCIAMVLGVFDGIPGMEGVMMTEVYAAGTANDLVSVAVGEEGKGSGSRYTRGAGNQQWCAYFVWWCAEQAGIPSNVIPNTASSSQMYTRLMNSGARVVSSPQAGDLVFYKARENKEKGEFCHVAIMISASESMHGGVGSVVKRIPQGYYTPVYNFINGRLVDESTDLKPFSQHLFLCVFRHF